MSISTLEIQRAYDTELTRLLALGLSPEQEEIARRYYSQKERDSMDESDFCGPHQTYPVKTAEDVKNAARLIGHADNPDAVKRCVIGKAKAHGWSLPESWQEEEDKKRADTSEIIRADGLTIASDGSHDAYTGTHTHAHPAFGSQGDDASHEHEHAHDGDANHRHSHEQRAAATPEIVRTLPSETTIYAPILRVDRAKREVVVRATAEDLDSYGTVIGFEGSKDAFSRWRGNIREMHDPTKAVGRAIKWEPIDETKEIELVLRVSKGAEDTWQKCLDGTLAGASIGARNGTWGEREWKGKKVPFLERYDLVEVSLVDNPSCPGCDVKVVRADGCATDVLDFSEESPIAEPSSQDITRAGARISAPTMTSMHKARDHAFAGLREQLANCPCEECQGALKVLDPDGDGDVDIVGSLDTDHDAAGGDGSGIMKFVQTEITRHMAPITQRLNGIAARLAAADTTAAAATLSPDITRQLTTLEQRLTGLDEVRSLLSEVKGLAEKSTHLSELIAAQPQAGGPIVNSAVLRQMAPSTPDPVAEETAIISRLARAGILNKNQQVEAALYLQRLAHEQAAPGRR